MSHSKHIQINVFVSPSILFLSFNTIVPITKMTHYANEAMTSLSYFSYRGTISKTPTICFLCLLFSRVTAAHRTSYCGRAVGDVGEVRRDGVLLCGLHRVLGALPHRHQKHGYGLLLHGCSGRNHQLPVHHLSGSVARRSVRKPCLHLLPPLLPPPQPLCVVLLLLPGRYNKKLPYILMGSLAICGSILCLLLPETFKKPLPETMDQMQQICRSVDRVHHVFASLCR